MVLRNLLKPFLAAAVIAAPAFSRAQITPASLRVEHRSGEVLINADDVCATAPSDGGNAGVRLRFSWINEAAEGARGERQTACRICVASSAAALEQGRPDVWDSKKMRTSDSHLVDYAGGALKEATTYYWRVKVWNAKGKPSAWSETGKFTVGISHKHWKAQWIGAPWNVEAPQYSISEGKATLPPTPVPMFRKVFRAKKGLLTAKAFVTGLGYFELYVNGRKAGDDLLVPDFTNYTARRELSRAYLSVDEKSAGYHVSYLQYDITDMLREGDNAAGAMVAGGYFDNRSSRVGAFASPRFICQIEMTYDDGTTQTVITDDSWRVAESPIVRCDMYEGEDYDARKETPGWSMPSFDDSSWQRAVVREAPKGRLTAHDTPADKVSETLCPVTFKRNEDGSYTADFGEMISGWVRLKGVRGSAGQQLDIRYESEYPQQVSYIFKDGEPADYAPRFTWYVFRSVRISGAELTEDMLAAEVVNTDIKEDVEFSSSSPLFNEINKIWLRTEKDNVHSGVESDCPHRERLPYTGDAQVVCATVMHNFDAASFYRSWFDTMRDSQDKETGYVPNSAPWCIGAGGGVAWGAAMTLMPWEHYLHYGDKQVLLENYAAACRQVDYMLRWTTPEGVMRQKRGAASDGKEQYWFNLGDWVPPFSFPEDEKVHTYMLWRCADRLSRAADILGRDEDAARYRALAERTAKAFDRQYYNAAEKSYGDYGCNIMAVDMGAAEGKLDVIKETLVKEIVGKYNSHVNAGYIGTALFYETLGRIGLNDVAFDAMSQTDYPSFGHWIEQGATTFWEQYDGQNSRNHPFLGGALTWFYRTCAGVYADEACPGYRHVIIAPTLARKLNRVKYAKQTPYGRVSSEVAHNDEELTMTVEIPVGATATVRVPTSSSVEPSVNGAAARKVKGVKSVSHTADGYSVEVAQGRYVIRTECRL